MKIFKLYSMGILTLSLLASCSDDDTPTPVEEEESITKLVLTFTNQVNTSDTVVLTWNDENGDEVVDESEQIVSGVFESNQVYDAELALFNEDENFLDEDILADQAGIDAHFFVYATTLDFTMERADNDEVRTDNNKLGVKTTWATGNSGTGSISIELYHESPNVSDMAGFGTAEGNDTDIDISFNVVISDLL